MKRLRAIFFSLLFPLAFLSTLIVPSVASAATMHTTQATRIHVTLTGIKKSPMRKASAMAAYTCGTNCNGVNPDGTPCAQGAQTVLSAYIQDPYDRTKNWGMVEMRWSPTCGTNWTRVTSFMGTQEIYGLIEHPAGQDGPAVTYSSQIQHATQTWTLMVYAPDDPVASIGNITINAQSSACVTNPGASCA